MNTTLKLTEIKKKIIEELNVTVAPNGYKAKNLKNESTFLKKHDNGYLQIQLLYDNYFPIDYAIRVVFFIYQSSIQVIRKEFYKATNQEFLDSANIVFVEGNFIEELKEKPFKYKHSYKNNVRTESDLEEVINNYKDLVTNYFFPLEKSFSTMEGTNDFIKANKDLAVEHAIHGGMLETSLIAAKRLKDPDYLALYEHYLQELTKTNPVGVFAKKPIEKLVLLRGYLDAEKNE